MTTAAQMGRGGRPTVIQLIYDNVL